MPHAATFQLGRLVRQYAEWQGIASDQRSPAPAGWWGPAIAALHDAQPMPAEWSEVLGLPHGSSRADGARKIIDQFAEQTSLPWPDEFPRKYQWKEAN